MRLWFYGNQKMKKYIDGILRSHMSSLFFISFQTDRSAKLPSSNVQGSWNHIK